MVTETQMDAVVFILGLIATFYVMSELGIFFGVGMAIISFVVWKKVLLKTRDRKGDAE